MIYKDVQASDRATETLDCQLARQADATLSENIERVMQRPPYNADPLLRWPRPEPAKGTRISLVHMYCTPACLSVLLLLHQCRAAYIQTDSAGGSTDAERYILFGPTYEGRHRVEIRISIPDTSFGGYNYPKLST